MMTNQTPSESQTVSDKFHGDSNTPFDRSRFQLKILLPCPKLYCILRLNHEWKHNKGPFQVALGVNRRYQPAEEERSDDWIQAPDSLILAQQKHLGQEARRANSTVGEKEEEEEVQQPNGHYAKKEEEEL
jgi:hypothetical protein